jgi:hypothetical protein
LHIYLCLTCCAFEHQVTILHSHCVVGQEIELCQKDEEELRKLGGHLPSPWLAGLVLWSFGSAYYSVLFPLNPQAYGDLHSGING